MKKMAAAQFKARCLRIMDDVAATRQPIVITKKGRPVAKLVPAEDVPQDFLGKLAKTMKIVGDITKPIEEPEAWDALR
jgi:prevent-host-death family protein